MVARRMPGLLPEEGLDDLQARRDGHIAELRALGGDGRGPLADYHKRRIADLDTAIGWVLAQLERDVWA